MRRLLEEVIQEQPARRGPQHGLDGDRIASRLRCLEPPGPVDEDAHLLVTGPRQFQLFRLGSNQAVDLGDPIRPTR